MSYSFNWDCTLPIKNIEDIVSINIVPETTVYDEGDYLSLRGQVCIDGEYLSSTKEQFIFNECIPLDITLPNNDRTTNIKIDVENFDYTIEEGNRLCLNIRLCIAGYHLDSTPTLVEPDEEEEVQEQPPVIFTKEALISPKSVAAADVEDLDYLDFDEVAMPAHQEAVELVDEEPVEKDQALPKPFLSEVARKEVVSNQPQQEVGEEKTETTMASTDEFVSVTSDHVEEAVVEVVEAEVVEELHPVVEEEVVEEIEPVVESVSDSETLVEESRKETLTDKIKQILNKEPVVVEKKSEPVAVAPVAEVVEEVTPVEEKVVEVVEKVVPVEEIQVAVEEASPQPVSQSTGWEEVLSDKTAMTKYHPIMPIPVVKEEVTEAEETVEEEEILPFPLKQSVTEVSSEEPAVKEKSNLFDMLYGLDQEEEPVVVESQETVSEEVIPTSTPTLSQPVIQKVQVTQQMTQPVQVAPSSVAMQPALEEVEESNVPVNISSSSDDSIASQFSDGESIIKIVFVQEEETTIDDICTKYNVTQDNIYNCANTSAPLCPGDHVMINYGQFRRN